MKTEGLTMTHQWAADQEAKTGGSRALKIARFAGRGLKGGIDYLFGEEEQK